MNINHRALIILVTALVGLAGCGEQKTRTLKSRSSSKNSTEDSQDHLYSKFDESTPKDAGFNPRIAVDAFEPITEFPVVAARNVGNRVRDEDLVLGIELNGKSRAYPIQQLCGPQREIVNDKLGGQAIAPTW